MENIGKESIQGIEITNSIYKEKMGLAQTEGELRKAKINRAKWDGISLSSGLFWLTAVATNIGYFAGCYGLNLGLVKTAAFFVPAEIICSAASFAVSYISGYIQNEIMTKKQDTINYLELKKHYSLERIKSLQAELDNLDNAQELETEPIQEKSYEAPEVSITYDDQMIDGPSYSTGTAKTR